MDRLDRCEDAKRLDILRLGWVKFSRVVKKIEGMFSSCGGSRKEFLTNCGLENLGQCGAAAKTQ